MVGETMVLPGIGRGYYDPVSVTQANQTNPSEWLFYGRQYESRSAMMTRLIGLNGFIPSGITAGASAPPAEPDTRPKFKPKSRAERGSWFGFGNLLTNIKDAFFGDDKDDYEGMTDDKKQKLKDAREAGRSNFWGGFWKGAIKAVVATVVVGVALAATGITFGAAAPLLVVAGVAMAAWMTADAIKQKAEAEERLTEAVITGDDARMDRIVNQDMGSSGDQFGTGVTGLVLGLWAGIRNVGSAGRNVGTGARNLFRPPTARLPGVPSPTAPTVPTPASPPVPRTWTAIRADAAAGAYPSSHNAALAQLGLGGYQAVTAPSSAVTDFNERNGLVAARGGAPGTAGNPPMPARYDVSCSSAGYGAG